MRENHAEWLASHTEEIIDPKREIIDPHHHLWPMRHGSRYELPEFFADFESGHNVTKTVFIECGAGYQRNSPEPMAPVAETTYVEAMAQEVAQTPARPQIAAIVAHANLTLPIETLDTVLDAHAAASPRFRGIRHAGAWDEERDILQFAGQPIQHLYLDPDFQRGVAHLGTRGLTYDTWHFHPQNREFLSLARAVPDTTLILDHFGTPMGVGRFTGKRDARFSEWQDEMSALAECPNVIAKLGGLAMPTNGFGWDTRDGPPPSSDEIVEAHEKYYAHMIAEFGPDRCMFESNFPVDKYSVSYPVLWNALKKLAAPYDAAAQEAMFVGTAARVYTI
ncbi:amidohydrolase family protein [Rhodalgimonas zhirmunskyi]|uniref:Amidohydrolase family protein n=1 Tax=Rhodalgimonas zhirmunskyi TaxID=2964767 RepID=A0AAJ1X497_9RHOB|nr:amidohydrolase family protein [Rhodoalgimonas zhirmunskyi]MDQ2092899.1 amidohydrolase family protein [Rhodoalgimonas zhirmunskyi]